MSLLGQAALAMWWDIAPAARADFEDWHAHEHFPERLGVPGFRRGTRWSDAGGGEGAFVIYELEDHATLASPAYAARLNAPTPWSSRLMPEHRNMVRSQCRVLASQGGGIARHALTLRLTARPGGDDALGAHLGALVGPLALRPGLTGAHLLRHETPHMAMTTEQKIRRGNDQVAAWVFVVCGYDRAALESLRTAELAPDALGAHGADGTPLGGLYTLAYSATPGDVT
jgi:hypothetical protein